MYGPTSVIINDRLVPIFEPFLFFQIRHAFTRYSSLGVRRLTSSRVSCGVTASGPLVTSSKRYFFSATTRNESASLTTS